MGHAFRDTARGDLVELKKAFQGLQQQCNDRVEAAKLLHVENQRLKQHIKGLESQILKSADVAPSSPAVSAATTSSSWSGRLASTTASGTLRSSSAGQASALRVFKRAAVQARAAANGAATELHSTQQQLQLTQQQLKHLCAAHEELQAMHVVVQRQLSSSLADNAALQDQVQRMQQVCQDKQQQNTHLCQQLKLQNAQQQVQQEGYSAAHQQEVQELQAAHKAELHSFEVRLTAQHMDTLDAAQQRIDQLTLQLQRAQHVLQQLTQLEQGHPAGWTGQLVSYTTQPISSSAMPAAPATNRPLLQVADSQQLDQPLALLVLLHSMTSQPGLLGVSKRDWWPLLLFHTASANKSAEAPRRQGQLLTAVAAKPATACLFSSAAGQHPAVASQNVRDSKDGSAASGGVLHHQLQLQLPMQLEDATVEWMKAGQLQLSLVNAQAAVVGVFKVSGDFPDNSVKSSETSGVQATNQQPTDCNVVAVLLPLDTTCKCWVLGLFEFGPDCQPGGFLGYLSGCASSSSCPASNTRSLSGGLPWSTTADWQYPDLLAGEFLVPEASKIGPSSAKTSEQQSSPFYTAALNSGLFKTTCKQVLLECALAGDSRQSQQQQSSMSCEVWTIQPAAERAAVSRAYSEKDLAVAAEPWVAAGTVYGTAVLEVGTALAAVTASELATISRQHLLHMHINTCRDSSSADGGARCDQQLAHVALVHSRGKTVAQVQLVLRYNQPAAGALRRCEDLKQLETNYQQQMKKLIADAHDQAQLLQEQQQQIQQQELKLAGAQHELQVLDTEVSQLQNNMCAQQKDSEVKVAQLRQQLSDCVQQHAAEVAQQQQKIVGLIAENEHLQRMVEEQLQQLDELEERSGVAGRQ